MADNLSLTSPLTQAILNSGNPALYGTIPKLGLAQAYMENGASSAPATSLQALGRVVQSIVGNQMVSSAADKIGANMSGQNAGLIHALTHPNDPTDTSAQPQPAQSSGGIGHWISGLFGGGDSSSPPQSSGPAPASQTTAGAFAPVPTQGGGMASGGAAGPSPAPSGGPAPAPSAAAPGIGSMGQAAAGPGIGSMGQAVAAVPQSPATAVAQRMQTAQALIASPYPALRMQGAQMLQQLQQEQAAAEIEAQGKLLQGGKRMDAVTGAITGDAGFNTAEQQTESAKALGTGLGQNNPTLTAAKVAATNTENYGTSASAAAHAGATANATAMAENAPNVAAAAASKGAAITHATALAAASPDVATAEAAKGAAIKTAQQDVQLHTQPAIDAATTEATNAANAGKPLTPEQTNAQEQALSKAFQESEIYKRYTEASQAYMNVQNAAADPTKAGDIGLVDSVVKLFNPQATVRQGSFNNFMEHGQGLPDNVIGIVKSWYGNGGHLQPDTRQQLVGEATNYMNSSRQVYGAVANFAKQQAGSQGLNPANVVPKFIDPLTAREELARRQAAQAQPGMPPQTQAPQ